MKGPVFVMGKDESMENIRNEVRQALPGQMGGGKKNSKEPGMSCWVKDFSHSKVVYEHDGKTYGRKWQRDAGTGKITFGPATEVEEEYVAKNSSTNMLAKATEKAEPKTGNPSSKHEAAEYA